jgi:hypothetical protein
MIKRKLRTAITILQNGYDALVLPEGTEICITKAYLLKEAPHGVALTCKYNDIKFEMTPDEIDPKEITYPGMPAPPPYEEKYGTEAEYRDGFDKPGICPPSDDDEEIDFNELCVQPVRKDSPHPSSEDGV